ncbi:hypothetical protein SH611_17525 [Geminicoccaceae bacterium 1502E]|nr:hypothetical protein [Geminicoccaceae bacterium 1502E]
MSFDPTGVVQPSVDEAELHAFVDGSLPPERRAPVLAYLLANPAERERVESYRRQASLLGEVRDKLDALDSAAFKPQLQRRLADALAHQRRRRSWVRGAAAAAVATVTLAGSLWGFTQIYPTEPRSTRVAGHNAPEFPFGGSLVVPAAVGPGADGEASMSWLGQHLSDQTVTLPDLSGLGLKLSGAGVVPQSNAPAVRLVYSDVDGQHLMLFMGVVSSSAAQAFTLMPEGYLSLHWRRGSLIFALAGPAESPRLYEVMRRVSDGVTHGGGSAPARQVEAAAAPAAPKGASAALLPVGVTTEATSSPAKLPAASATEAKPTAEPLPATKLAEQPKSL